jgi:hypothetical protein
MYEELTWQITIADFAFLDSKLKEIVLKKIQKRQLQLYQPVMKTEQDT